MYKSIFYSMFIKDKKCLKWVFYQKNYTFVTCNINNQLSLIVQKIKLIQFRNYKSLDIDFHSRVNALTGSNGMGKTNILDALYYMCLGKSYFASGDRNVVMQQTDFFRIEGEVMRYDYPEQIVVKVQIGNKKEIISSGKKAETIGDHIGHFPVVIIAPDDVQIMLDGSEARRNFLNNTIIQSDQAYLADLVLYNNLLKRRNSILKSFLDGRKFDSLLLESVTTPMYPPAHRIHTRRQEIVSKLSEVFAKTYEEIAQSYEQCSLTYESQLNENPLPYLMDRNLERDRFLGRTTQGIHKDDLDFEMNENPLKNYASQGQLKSFVLALKIAQYRMIENNTDTKPILLLDDIFDKLDMIRVKRLVGLLVDKDFGQIFITDTHTQRISEVLDSLNTEYRLFNVENGKVI